MNYERLYAYRFRGVDQAARREVWQVIAGHVYEAMGRPNCVLDPAGGRLEFINAIPAKERWVVDEVSYAEGDTVEGVRVIIGDVLEADLPASHFDGVFISNFLEHLRSPEQFASLMEVMIECMMPGGTIAMMGPNFKYCGSQYYDCVDHHLALTHVSVGEMLYQAGFEIVRTVPRFLPFSFRGLLPPSPKLAGLYLRLPIAWPIFGKQFIVYAKKPA